MSKRNIALAGVSLLSVALLLFQVPAINSRFAWRFEVAKTYLKNVIHPVGSAPTAIPNTPVAAANNSTPISPVVTPTMELIATAIPPTATLAPPPPQSLLASPPYEKQ